MDGKETIPSVFQYVESLHETEDYKAFDADESIHMAKDTQYAYHIVASTTDSRLFNSWAPSLLASGHPMLLEAIARNPIASPSHLQVLLANPKVSAAVLLYIARHPKSTVPIINKVLFVLSGDPRSLFNGDGEQPALYLALAARNDLTPDHVTVLMRKNMKDVNSLLAMNPVVSEQQRILAALSL
jgi:hypothetical protein